MGKKDYEPFVEVPLSLEPDAEEGFPQGSSDGAFIPAATSPEGRPTASSSRTAAYTNGEQRSSEPLKVSVGSLHEGAGRSGFNDTAPVASTSGESAGSGQAAAGGRFAWLKQWRLQRKIDPLRTPLGSVKLSAVSSVDEGGGSRPVTANGLPNTAATKGTAGMPGSENAVPEAAPAVHLAVKGWLRTYYVVLYCITIAFLYADQNLLSPTMSDIAEDFGFDEKEKDLYLGSFISGAFFAIGAPAALLVGYISDRFDRKWLLFILVVIGEGPCLATPWVTEYWQLFILRVMTGISLGGSLPLAYAMVGDLYSSHQRSTVSAGVQLSSGAGIAVGQAIAGFVGPWLGWRAPFVCVAIPALLLALLLVLSTRDPPRGACEEGLEERVDAGYVYSEKMDAHKLKRLVTTPSNFFIIMQGLPGCLPWGIILIYLNDFLAIPSGKGLGTQKATAVVLVNGIGGALGVIGGGGLGQWLYNRNPPDMPTMVGVAVLLATVPMYLLINLPFPGGWVALAFVLSFLVGVLAGCPGPNVRAILLNVNDPEARGMALALQTVLDDLGKGLGPFIIGLLAQVMSRQWAFNIAVLGWIPCGLLLMGARWYIVEDEEAMHRRLREVAKGSAELVSSALPQSDQQHTGLDVGNGSDVGGELLADTNGLGEGVHGSANGSHERGVIAVATH